MQPTITRISKSEIEHEFRAIKRLIRKEFKSVEIDGNYAIIRDGENLRLFVRYTPKGDEPDYKSIRL